MQTTVREANDRGYDCLVVSDATESYFAHFKQATLEMSARDSRSNATPHRWHPRPRLTPCVSGVRVGSRCARRHRWLDGRERGSSGRAQGIKLSTRTDEGQAHGEDCQGSREQTGKAVGAEGRADHFAGDGASTRLSAW